MSPGSRNTPVPSAQLLVGRRLTDGGERQRRQHDRQPDPGTAPEQLLHHDRQRQPGGVTRQFRIQLPLVEPLARRVLEHRPRQLLPAVVLRCDRTNDLARERVALLPQPSLLVGELEVEGARRRRYARHAHPAARLRLSRLEAVRVQVVLRDPLESDPVDLAGRVERHLVHEDDLFGAL